MPTQPQRLHYDANWYLGRVWAGAATRFVVGIPASMWETNQLDIPGLDFYLPARPRSARRVVICMVTAYHVPK